MFTTGFAPGAAWNDTQWDHPRFNVLLTSARAELENRFFHGDIDASMLSRDEHTGDGRCHVSG